MGLVIWDFFNKLNGVHFFPTAQPSADPLFSGIIGRKIKRDLAVKVAGLPENLQWANLSREQRKRLLVSWAQDEETLSGTLSDIFRHSSPIFTDRAVIFGEKKGSMKEKILRASFVMILALILASNPLFASTAADVKKGNLLYNSKKYDEAIKVYDSAMEKRGDNGMLRFNKGNALYRKESFNAAVESFNKAIASGSQRILPDADYNIGNSYYRIGTAQAKTDYNKTKDAYETALQFYKRAMDLNPNDKNAKYNYEFVEQKLLSLKERSEKEKKKQENQEQDKRQDKKDQPSQNKGGQGAFREICELLLCSKNKFSV